jgi:protein SCO1
MIDMRMTAKTIAAALGAVVLLGAGADTSSAQYFRRPASNVDPRVLTIDEKAVLGNKISADTEFVDEAGKTVRWDSMLGKPLILVLSYYTCDGSCSAINGALADLLKDVTAVKPGEDFRIVTVSFDKHDNLQSTGAFREHLKLKGSLGDAWTFATFKNEADLKRETEKIGFKFFWSPEDRSFLHPGAFLFFSPEGRLIRVLYQQDVGARDVELAVLDANQNNFRPTDIANLVLSLCYSYNYADGKYKINLPLYIGLGALISGLLSLLASLTLFRFRRKGRTMKGAKHAQPA